MTGGALSLAAFARRAVISRIVLLVVATMVAGCAAGNRTQDLAAAAAELSRASSSNAPCTFNLPVGGDSTRAVVDEPPELVGGLEGLAERVSYPELARRAGIQGTVCLQFVVDEEGSVQDVQVVRSAHALLDAEAERAVLASTFRPGFQDGEAVEVRFLLPVAFRLRGGPDPERALFASAGLLAILGVVVLLKGTQE